MKAKKTVIRRSKSPLAKMMGEGWIDHHLCGTGVARESSVVSKCGRLILTRRKMPGHKPRYEAVLHNRKKVSGVFIAYGSTPKIAIKGAINAVNELVDNLQSLTAGLKF